MNPIECGQKGHKFGEWRPSPFEGDQTRECARCSVMETRHPGDIMPGDRVKVKVGLYEGCTAEVVSVITSLEGTPQVGIKFPTNYRITYKASELSVIHQ